MVCSVGQVCTWVSTLSRWHRFRFPNIPLTNSFRGKDCVHKTKNECSLKYWMCFKITRGNKSILPCTDRHNHFCSLYWHSLLIAACSVFIFCSRLQRSINAFFETTQESGANSLTGGGEGELVGSAKWVHKRYYTICMRHVLLKRIQGCSEVKVLQQLG
jgi:hypothetical protein